MAAGAGDGGSPATLSGGSAVVVGREGIFDHRCTQIHADKIRSSDASTVPDLICVHLCASVVETACFLVRTESAISAHVGRYASTYGPGDRMSVFERNRLGDLTCNPCSVSSPSAWMLEWEDRMPLSQRDGIGTDDALASWNDGPTKQSILDFVARVTQAGSPDY